MESVFRLTALVVVVSACTEAYNLPNLFLGRPKGGFLRPPELNRTELNRLKRDTVIGWFEQRLDHFNPSDTRTWKQKYFKAGPDFSDTLFVMLGGEGAASAGWMHGGMWVQYAQTHGAVRLQLEHRYYGQSHPVETLSQDNLRYLSTEQALSDAASFITAMKVQFGATKCIVFGGSYSGALAAWARLKYPHLIDGAVANSAPLLAEADFKGYLEVVNDALNTYRPVNACNNAFSEATKALEEKIKTPEGRQEFKKQFNLCDDIDINAENDIYNLFLSLASNIMSVVQYNNISSNPADPTIRAVCKVMTNSSLGDPVDRYAKVTAWLTDGSCVDFKYSNLIAYLHHEDWQSPAVTTGYRPWLHQICTEVGYFLTSDSDKQPFGHDFPAKLGYSLCSDIFSGFTESFVDDAISGTNVDYGARQFAEDRVVFVNGNIDPWHAVSVTHKLPKASVIFMRGTAHCANMYPRRASDPPDLVAARPQIASLIDQWLQ